jgi:hypothetical protein
VLYFVEYMAGGAGKFLSRSVNVADKLVGDNKEPLRIDEIPGLRRILKAPSPFDIPRRGQAQVREPEG